MINRINFENVDEKTAHLQSLVNIPSINPKSYDQDAEYFRLDFIDHPDYGVGFVEEVVDEHSIKVFFNDGEQVVAHRDFLQQKIS